MSNRSGTLPQQRTYNVGYHGPKCHHDLQGIATLTHNPLALDNISYETEAGLRERLDAIKQKAADMIGVPEDYISMRAVGTSSRSADGRVYHQHIIEASCCK